MPSSAEHLVSEASLRAFCAAMNTPVVDIEHLDTCPARGAIALYVDEYGGQSLAIAVRSVTSGENVIFRYQGDPTEFGSAAGALEAALGFAEGMGFIFEDDLIEIGGAAGRRRAAKIWAGLTRSSEREPALVSVEEDLDELEIDDLDESGELVLTEAMVGGDDALEEAEIGTGPETMTFVGAMSDDSGGPVRLVDEPDDAAPRTAKILTKFRRGDVKRASAEESRVVERGGVDEGAHEADSGPDPSLSSSLPFARMGLQKKQKMKPNGGAIHDGAGFLTRLLASF